MSKRLTSLLVGALAAVLLGAPAQAQQALRANPHTGFKAVNAQQVMKKSDLSTIQADQQQRQDIEASMERAADKHQQEVEKRLSAPAISFRGLLPMQVLSLPKVPTNLPHYAAAPTVDEDGIIISPDAGEHKYYKRAGGALYPSGQQVNIGTQSGTIEVVECEDGTVYFKDIISYIAVETWVKGTIEDGKIVVPCDQLIYVDDEGYLLKLAWGYVENASSVGIAVDNDDPFVFSIVGDDLYLEGTCAYNEADYAPFLGAKWELDGAIYLSGYGDYNTVLTYLPGYEPGSAIVGPNVDNLPYFTTLSNEAEVGVVDNNNDGQTWTVGYQHDPYIGARYNYNSYEDADDYLFTPGILLQAGKSYDVSFETFCAVGYDERIEVLAGAGPKIANLDITVIPATDITWGIGDIQTLEGSLTVPETGYYNFALHAISDADRWYIFATNFTVEEGALPTAPAAVEDINIELPADGTPAAIITFTAPTKTIGGDALTEITKIDVLRDKEVIASITGVAPGEEVTFVDDAATLGTHTYQLIPYNADGVGQKSEVISFFVTGVSEVPYLADLSTASAFGAMMVIDANGDNSTWRFNTTFNAATYSYNSANDADDYLVTSPVRLKAGKNYNVVVNANAYQSSYPERFEVVVGAAADPAEMDIVAIEAVDLTDTDPSDYEGEFQVDEDGEYYVAVHAISDANEYYLIVHSILVEEGAIENGPAAPRLSVQPNPYGAEKAVVTVTAPALTTEGDKITAPLARLDVTRDGQVIKSFENVNASDIKVFSDEVAGQHRYQAVAWTEEGRGEKSELVKAYVGLDVPSLPFAVVANETPDGVSIQWDRVTEGVNGGIVVPTDVVYELWTGHWEQVWFWYVLVLDEQVAATTETDIEMYYDQDVAQHYESLYLVTSNAAGNYYDYVGDAYPVYFHVGEPLALPIEEHFGNPFNYNTWLLLAWGNGNGVYSDESTDEDGSAVQITGEGAGDSYDLVLGKIETVQGNETLIIDVKGDGSSVNTFNVNVSTPDGKAKTLATIVPTEDYETYKISLAQFADQEYIKVGFSVEFEEAGAITFDNLRIVDLYPYNLSVAVKAPKNVQAGKSAEVDVVVRNVGEEEAAGYTVTLTADGKELLKETVTEALGSFQSKVLTATFPTTIFDEAKDVTLKAVVDYDLELDDEDNTATGIIAIKQSTAAAPEDVTAENTGNGVKLSWNAPSSTTQEVTDDVEEYEDNANGGLFDYDNEEYLTNTGKIGEWTVYDGTNGEYGYGFNGVASCLGMPGSWIVFNPLAVDAGLEAYTAHSGDKYFISACKAADEAPMPDTDNWLISPALPGIAQTISFWVRELVTDYGVESYEILYSTTDNKIESFQLLEATTCASAEWEEVSFDLPAGTTYFAIRHTSNDVWGLMVDDITYTAGGGEVVGYNVYVDGTLAGTVTTTSIEIEFSDEVTASSVFAVSAVYSNGAESKPVVVTLSSPAQEITGIDQITGSREPADVYSLDGRLVRSQATDLRGLRGAYIINGQKVVIK